MLIFRHSKSYLWLFPVYATLFLGGFVLCEAVGRVKWGVITMPAFVACVLLCELRSGVALDSWWRASYLKGSWQYRALIAWHGAAVAFFTLFAYIFAR